MRGQQAHRSFCNRALQSELDAQMGKARRVRGAPVEDELAQGGEPGLRKESARTSRSKPELEQAAVEHGLHRGWDFWLKCRQSSRRSRLRSAGVKGLAGMAP
jgi:hypothetical protein